MKNKIKILSISKRSHRSELRFPKEQKLFDILRKFLINLGFDVDDEFSVEGIGRPYNNQEDGEIIMNKEEEIKKYKEMIANYTNKDYSVDIIYFSEKVFVIINYKKDKQKQISDALKDLIYEEK